MNIQVYLEDLILLADSPLLDYHHRNEDNIYVSRPNIFLHSLVVWLLMCWHTPKISWNKNNYKHDSVINFWIKQEMSVFTKALIQNFTLNLCLADSFSVGLVSQALKYLTSSWFVTCNMIKNRLKVIQRTRWINERYHDG